MAIMRVHKTKNYTVMSNTHLRDKNLSLKAKGLLSMMLSMPDDWKFSIAGLVSVSKEDETAIKSGIRELKENGYVVVTKKTPKETESGRFEYEYDIFEDKIQAQKKQGAEIQGLVFRSAESPAVADGGLYKYTEVPSTEIQSTEIQNTSLFKKERSASAKSENYDSIIDSETENEQLREAYREFVKMRKLKKDPMTNHALKLLIGKVNKLSGGNEQCAKDLLDEAIINGWKSVYPPKNYNNTGGSINSNATRSGDVFLDYLDEQLEIEQGK